MCSLQAKHIIVVILITCGELDGNWKKKDVRKEKPEGQLESFSAFLPPIFKFWQTQCLEGLNRN